MGVLSPERDRMLRGKRPSATVWRHFMVNALCPAHGRQAHLSYLGGRCQRCHEEGLQERGLIR